MNKKNLSVVLAGAMLATSVAPVLADTTTAKEYSVDDIKLLENEIVSIMKTKMLTTNSVLKGDTIGEFVSTEVKNILNETNQSAYGVKLLDEKGNEVGTVEYDTNEVGNVLANVKEGYTVELIERETSEFKGQLIPGTKILKKETTETKYVAKDDFKINSSTVTDLAIKSTLIISDNKIVKSVDGVGDLVMAGGSAAADDYYKSVKVTTNTPVLNDLNKTKEFVLAEGDKKIDVRLPLDENGNLLDYKVLPDVAKFASFETDSDWTPSQAVDKTKLKETYKMTAAAKEENTFKASDLYDGVVLKAKGTELAAELLNAKENAIANGSELVKISALDKSTNSSIPRFKVFYYQNADKAAKDTTPNGTGAYKTITVYSTNEKEIDALQKLLDPANNTKSYQVGIVGGANRYATAVNVAKANNTTVAANGNIVLVNGDSLVDGLSAAPLAADKNAPVLLTKAGSLSKETKEYINLLTEKLNATQKKSITINLVGGESVLKDSLVKELEDMGFYVERFGGDNREATSLAVAKEVADNNVNTNDAFVVGGNGEADAMAISAVAAGRKTPIIVSSVNGLSADALGYLKNNSAKGDVTIVGGESVVSADEEKAVNESLTLNKAERIAGANRFETNAKIIEEFYKDFGTDNGAEAVVVVKDGQSNKGDLVDALSAANYAASKNAPIVLASKALNTAQKNALLKMDITAKSAKSMKLAVQVGEGAERSVLEAVANLFGLSNK